MKNIIQYLRKSDSTLRAFSLKLTKDPSDADDLYQETVFRILKNVNSFRPGTNFIAWAGMIMKNIFINNYRKKTRRISILNRKDYTTYPPVPDTHASNLGESNLELAEINEMINSLKLDVRLPFIKMYQGYPYQEIADQLNLPIGTVKSRIFFARKKLKEMYYRSQNHIEKYA